MAPSFTPQVSPEKFPVGQRVSLPGHFLAFVTLEGIRFIGSGYECRVRLPDGSPDEAILSLEEGAALAGQTIVSPTAIQPANAEKLRLLVESARIRLAYAHDRQFAVSLSGIRTLPHQIEAVYMKMLPQPRLRFLLADDPGAGKTIMAGLLLKEMKLREAIERILILCPAPRETGKRAAFRLATAILMYSFGGRRRDGANGTQFLPPGITEAELLSVCVGPDLDSTTALACLKELKERCLYLHFDGVRYCFKKDPNVTLLVEQESDAVGRDEHQVEERIREMLEERITGRNAVIWKAKSGDVPDKEPSFMVAYMPLSFGTDARTGREAAAKEIFENYGNSPRKYRNGLGLAIPAAEQIEILRRSVRYLLAIEHVRDKAKQLNLTDEQKSQLREREHTEAAAAESGLLKLYAEVWLPKVTGDGIVIDVAAAGGRPLQTTLNDKKQARVHDRVMELLVDVQRRVFTTVNPSKVIELFKLGEGNPPTLGIRTSEVVDGFYSFLGFPRLLNGAVVQKAIAAGIKDRFFGYCSGAAPTLGSDGKYQVPLSRVRFNTPVGEDEIDLESGVLMMPQALPVTAPPATPGAEPTNVTADRGSEPTLVLTPPVTPGAVPGASYPGGASLQRSVEINFSADRNQLFSAWNAIANLADLAGKVDVTVRADSAEGFDKNKLQNGVLEPLRESDLIQ
jgi:hypothetical protein